MTQSVTHYVNSTIALEGTGPQPAGYGSPMFMSENAIGSTRLSGPFTTPADVVSAGHLSGSPPHVFASALVAQQPHTRQFYLGQARPGDADVGVSLSAILAEDTGSWYAGMQESRASADILSFAAAMESLSFPKIGLVQSSDASMLTGAGASYSAQFGGSISDGSYDLIFTGFGLVSPVTVSAVRTGGTPTDDDAMAVAMDAELDTALAGSLSAVLAPGSISNTDDEVFFAAIDGIPSGVITTAAPGSGTLTPAIVDADIATRLQQLGYLRTALSYYHDDAVELCGAWAGRCLAFDLDVRKGVWAYKKLNGIAGSSLDNAQVVALRNSNANYFAGAVATSGVPTQAFTAQGWMSGGAAGAGRRIDVTTTLDWARARQEEGFMGILLRETHGINFDNAGINRFVSELNAHFDRGIAAGHYVAFTVPEGEDREGLQTPAVIAPTLASTTVVERTARTLTLESVAYIGSFIERVNQTTELRQ